MNTCNICDKSFANKYSLAAHKSRYHPKAEMISPENKESDDAEAGESNHEESDHEETDHEELEADDETSNNGDESGADKTVSESGKNYSKQGSAVETEDTQTSGESDVLDSPDQLSDKRSTRKRSFQESPKSTYRARKRTRQYRNHKSGHLFTDDDDVIQLLSSINKKLHESGETTFGLLTCHRLKYEYFSKLATEMFGSPTEMEEYLSDEEFWLVDAICKNNIERVGKLLEENMEIVEKVLANVTAFAENNAPLK